MTAPRTTSRSPAGHTRALTSTTVRSAAMPRSTVCLTFDFDAMSVWFGYEHVTPAMLQRGEYGARVGVPRLLQMLERHELPATFFVPGHTLESFPEPSQAILDAGHELAHHSYAHVDPSGQPAGRGARRLRARARRPSSGSACTPVGYRSPSADLSASTLKILEEHGFLYDSSLMADDYRPYRPRIGDRVSQQQPLQRGREADLIEIPMCFELDDWPHFQFNFDPSRVGLSAPSKVLEIWQGELDYMDEHVDGGVLVVAMHPQVIGRGHRVAMLERFIEHARGLGASLPVGEVRAPQGASPFISASICVVDREHLRHVAAGDQQPVDGRAGEQVDHQLEVESFADLAAGDRPLEHRPQRRAAGLDEVGAEDREQLGVVDGLPEQARHQRAAPPR